MSVESKVINVTPAMAEEWLSHNIRNRRINENVINQYKRDMLMGAWVLNGEGVIFNEDGELIDGQHRLIAVKRANVTVPMLVITGIDRDIKLLNKGKARSVLDSIVIGEELPEALRRKTVITAVTLHITQFKKIKLTDTEIIKCIKLHESELMDAVDVCCHTSHKQKIRSDYSATLLATMYALEENVSKEELKDFWEIFNSGFCYVRGKNSAIVLRNGFINLYNIRRNLANNLDDRIDIVMATERAIYDFVHRMERHKTYIGQIKKRTYSKKYEDLKDAELF